MVIELNTKGLRDEMDARKHKREPIIIKYWLVTITLTSGEIVEFYIKARTIFDAYKKADEYAEFAELYKGKFVYLP